MVKLSLHTSNCDAANHFKIEELATAELELRIEFVDRPEFCRHSVAALRVAPFKLYR